MVFNFVECLFFLYKKIRIEDGNAFLAAMMKVLALGLLLISLLWMLVSAKDNGFFQCNCDNEGS